MSNNDYINKNVPNSGTLTLLVYTTIALFMSIALPRLTALWKKKVTMRHLWIASHGVFGFAMLSTFVVTSSVGTILVFGTVGFSWAVTAWIPYALLGTETAFQSAKQTHIPIHRYDYRPLSNENDKEDEQNLLQEVEDEEDNENDDEDDDDDISHRLGLIYGIHNLSICVPQILITLGMGLIWIVSQSQSQSQPQSPYQTQAEMNSASEMGALATIVTASTTEDDANDLIGVVWVLRLGGLFAFVAMGVATKIRDRI
jgi:solute carrier family 45 protein 1/2/4